MLEDKGGLEELKFLKRRIYKYGNKRNYPVLRDRPEGADLEEFIRNALVHYIKATKGMGEDRHRIYSFIKKYVHIDHDRKKVVIPRSFVLKNAKLSVLAEDLEFEGDLDVSDWTNLFELPLNLYVTVKLIINKKHKKDAERLKKEGKIEKFEIR
jgi:hypothetical protein